MKGFLIFMVLLVGGGIYLFTHTNELGRQAWASLVLEEGSTKPAFQEQMYADPAAFKVKYKVFLEKRAKLVKWIGYSGETALVLDLTRETEKLYGESVLGTEAVFGEMIFAKAESLLEVRDIQSGAEAWKAYLRYLELFPSGPHASEAQKMVQSLVVKYNFQ